MVSWTSLALLEVGPGENPPQVNAWNLFPTGKQRFSDSHKKISEKHIVKNTAHGIEHRVEQATDDHTQTILEKVYNTYNPADKRHIPEVFRKPFPKASPSLPSTSLAPLQSVIKAIIRPADTAGGDLLQSVPHILHTGLQTGGSIREGLPGTVSRFLQGVYILTRGIGIGLRRFRACRADSFSCSVPDCCASMYDFWAAISAV